MKKAVQNYEDMLSALSDEQKQTVMRTIGSKMEELIAHQNILTKKSFMRRRSGLAET